jgi:cell division protein FtsB
MTTEDFVTWGLRSLQNKYVAVTLVALFWATFIHDLGLPFVVREARTLNQMKIELAEVQTRNEALREQKANLLTNPQALERFARERYFMRRANEEVYRIVD